MSTYRSLPGSSFQVVSISADSRDELLEAAGAARALIYVLEEANGVYIHSTYPEHADDGTYSCLLVLEG